MAAPGTAPISVVLEPSTGSGAMSTDALLAAILRANDQVSDLIFSPGRLPQVEIHGQLLGVQGGGLRPFSADDTRRIASDLIGENKQALGLPRHLAQVAHLRDGIVLVTGPRGSGKSSTLAALLDIINQEQVCHIITIADPIEFLHNHKRATVHQRELHSDTPSIALALRAALRQTPNVILVGEMRDRETMEMVLEAAESGHLVLTSLNTVSVAKTVKRIGSSFPASEQASIRSRLARNFRYIVSQRLVPRRDGTGR